MEFFFSSQSPDRFDIIGAVITRAGVAIIYSPCLEKEREKPSGGEEAIQAPTPPIMPAVFFAAAIAEIGGVISQQKRNIVAIDLIRTYYSLFMSVVEFTQKTVLGCLY
jgi:drug/metabolite transporter superfamily protein YnfA